MKNVSKNFYLGSWIGAGGISWILLIIGWIVSWKKGWEDWYGFVGIAAIPELYVGIVMLVLWYKAWSVIQDGQTKISPGKAIGFLFIPFFNLYWVFRAVWGYAKEFNAYLRRHNLSLPQLTEGLFLFWCIYGVSASFITSVSMGIENSSASSFPLVTGSIYIIITGMNLIIGLFLVSEICSGINNMAEVQQETLLASFQTQAICLKCKNSMPANALFCSQCGTPTQKLEQNIRCPSCHSSISSTAKFCPDCGTGLAGFTEGGS